MLDGAPESAATARISSAPRLTSTVTTTVKTADETALSRWVPGMGGSLSGVIRRAGFPAYSDAVSENQSTPATSTEPKTESHDPAVPAAYAAFMRQGWGDRELDLPVAAVAAPAARRRQRLA